MFFELIICEIGLELVLLYLLQEHLQICCEEFEKILFVLLVLAQIELEGFFLLIFHLMKIGEGIDPL